MTDLIENILPVLCGVGDADEQEATANMTMVSRANRVLSMA